MSVVKYKSTLAPHLGAAVRSAPLARVVGQVLSRVPRPADLPRNVELAWPVLCPVGVSLPQVPTIGPWSDAVDVRERDVHGVIKATRALRAAAMKAATVRELAWEIDRAAAAHFARALPDGCVWALYLDANPVAVCSVLCLRPVFEPEPSPPARESAA